MHDLVIRDALLLDALGSPPERKDLAVQNGIISEIGGSLSGKQIVDADGLALMPGIIDNHTHYDAQITWDPRVSPSPALGVTTAVIGNCGFTIAPCRAAEKEIRELVGCLRRGVFMLTKGGHTPIPFLEQLAADTGRPVVIAALLHNSTNPDAVFADLSKIKEANERGRRLLGAVSCCPLSMDFTLHSPYVIEGLESWKPALPLKGEAFRKKIREKALRDSIRAELAKPAHFRLFNGEWDKVEVIAAQRSVADLAREANQDPLDFMLDLALAENLDTVFNALLLNSDEQAVGRMLRDPNSLVSLSDAGAHLTFFNDAGYGLHLLGHWVRELGVLKLEEA